MRTVLLLGLLIAVVWAVPAQANDDKDALITKLTAERDTAVMEARRVQAENTHLREAYNQLSKNATRGHAAIDTMTNSLAAAREMIAALQTENAKLREAGADRKDTHEDDVTKLRESLQAMTDRANQLTVLLAQPEQETKQRMLELTLTLDRAKEKLAKAEAALAAVRKALK